MADITKAASRMIKSKASVSTAGVMVAYTKDLGMLENSMVLELLSKKMAGDRKANGKTVNELNGSATTTKINETAIQ